MTAIAGLWRYDGRPDVSDDIRRMMAGQSAYGRDGTGYWHDGSVALGRSLARLLPEDRHDRQPLKGAGGNLALVADIRLDNREELAEQLAIPADRLALLCDADVALAAFERWGIDSFERLLGDFAIALWDRSCHRMILARDVFGQRPLHYHRAGTFLAFASMPSGLHALADIPYAPDEQSMAEFLALMAESGTRSFFQGIERVEPGHVTIVTQSEVSSRRYWQPSGTILRLKDRRDYVEAAREQLDRAVRCRLRGAQVVGAHLSAGLDSSGVAATAARLLQPSGGRVVAFTAVPRPGYSDPGWGDALIDEGPLAAATAARHANIEHVRITPSPRSLRADLDLDFLMSQRPVLNPCNTGWMHGIDAEAGRRGLRVMLTGFWGNMGLTYSGEELFAELVRRRRPIQWLSTALASLRHGASWRHILVKSFGPWLSESLWVTLHRLRHRVPHGLHAYTGLSPAGVEAQKLVERARETGHDFVYRPWKDGLAMRLWVLGRVDPANYHKGALGAWGIDHRDPTADRRLLEFCFSVPTEEYFADGQTRAFAQAVLADRLPPEVLTEKRRGRQGADWHERFTAAREDVAGEVERMKNCAPARQLLDVPKLEALVANWPQSGWAQPVTIRDYRGVLQRSAAGGHFLRRVTGGNA